MVRRFVLGLVLLAFAAIAFGAVAARQYLRRLDALVVEKFSGRRWDFPSKIYSAPTLLYPGLDIEGIGLWRRLRRLQYRPVQGDLAFPGEYRAPRSGPVDVYLREFLYPNGFHAARRVRLERAGPRITRIVSLESGEDLAAVELEPEVLAGLYENIWEERRLVRLDELPAKLIHAILATEDQRFFQHRGIDLAGIARAFWVNLTTGKIVQGGSTLTQQLMKNFFLTEERTVRRKVREIAMALVAERRYSKREILENYVNEIYLGQNGAQGIFGVREAAHFYFRKKPSDLTLAESALIAGLIKAPNRYSPFLHPERALRRRNYVLHLMHKSRLISEGELREATAAPLGVVPWEGERADAPYFVDFLRRELAQTYPSEVLTKEGLRIFTGLDPEMQRAAERALEEGLAALEKRYPRLAGTGGGKLQGCLVALEPQTGEIKAMMGGRDYSETQFNRVTQSRRQPGSIFKPFTYVAALDRPASAGGWNPTSHVEDAPFTWEYEGREWSPANYRGTYFGLVTVRQALELSLNGATARLAREVGLERVREVARRMGISSPLPLYPSMVLGSVEVSPLEVAQAYAVLANQGLRATPLAIRAVVDPSGRVVERHPFEVERAISPQVAFLVTHLLEGVLDRGTAASARRLGFQRPAAGKTGTTNEYMDAWFAGFTPDLLAVVWVGFDEKRPVGLSGSQAALPIWVRFMSEATAARPPRPFLPPPGVHLVRIDPLSGELATPACAEVIEEAFLADDEPKTPCHLHAALAGAVSGPQPQEFRPIRIP